MGGGGSGLPPLAAVLPGAAGLSDFPGAAGLSGLLGVAGLSDLADFAGLSDLMPAKLLNRSGKSWLTAHTSSDVHSGLLDFFLVVFPLAAFGGMPSSAPGYQLFRL